MAQAGFLLVFPLKPPKKRLEPPPKSGCGPKPMGSHFGVGDFTTHFRTYFSGWFESDVDWGYDFDSDPWPVVSF